MNWDPFPRGRSPIHTHNTQFCKATLNVHTFTKVVTPDWGNESFRGLLEQFNNRIIKRILVLWQPSFNTVRNLDQKVTQLVPAFTSYGYLLYLQFLHSGQPQSHVWPWMLAWSSWATYCDGCYASCLWMKCPWLWETNTPHPAKPIFPVAIAITNT